MKSEAILHDRASHCANCGAPAAGNFCPACGQETTLHVPSAREFLHEFIGHYVAFEGKLWKSLGLLLFKPGRLTLEYIQGRRVRYVQPLRLYLTLSILFFALLKYGPLHVVQVGPEDGKARTELQSAAPAPAAAHDDRTEEAAPAAAQAADGHGKHKLRGLITGLNPKWDERFARFNALSDEEKAHLLKSAFFGYVPYAMFCLMPVFALYLKLLYLGSGRRYGEHLLFALHTNGFAFLTLGLILVTPAGWTYVEWGLGAWLAFYLPTAMRRVYGGSRLVTALRWVALMLPHLLSIAAALVVALGLAIVA